MTIPYIEPKKTYSKYFLHIDKIISINFENESKTKYKWYDKTIKTSWYGKKTTIPAGWKYSEKAQIISSDELKKNSEYRVDDINKIVYDKAKVSFNMIDNIILSECFNTDYDALKFIAELIVKSGGKYQEFDGK